MQPAAGQSSIEGESQWVVAAKEGSSAASPVYRSAAGSQGCSLEVVGILSVAAGTVADLALAVGVDNLSTAAAKARLQNQSVGVEIPERTRREAVDSSLQSFAEVELRVVDILWLEAAGIL